VSGDDLGSIVERDQLYVHIRPELRGGFHYLEWSDGIEFVKPIEDYYLHPHIDLPCRA
jgi:hypothetical protein